MTPRMQPAASTYAYNAFISYKHADASIVKSIRAGLRTLGRPWYRVRNKLKIFLDEASMSANPALWPELEQQLKSSEFFILVASPDSAGSEWVQKEVTTWLAQGPDSVRRLIIVLTDGAIEWDAQARDFDWTATTALPRCLAGVFAEVPLYVDARWTRGGCPDSCWYGSPIPQLRDLTDRLRRPCLSLQDSD